MLTFSNKCSFTVLITGKSEDIVYDIKVRRLILKQSEWRLQWNLLAFELTEHGSSFFVAWKTDWLHTISPSN